MINRGVHGEKLVSLLQNTKLPISDKARVTEAIAEYDSWIENMEQVQTESINELVIEMVSLLNEYKFYIDVDLIFDSENDFLYRQKGQLKIDNTVIEEFLPLLAKKCLDMAGVDNNIEIDSQAKVYSNLYFESSIKEPSVAGGITIKNKDQDFSISRQLFLRASYDKNMTNPEEVATLDTKLGYILAEIKTNLDKTMFQEASATARDVKMAVTGSKYYLICDYLDMTPISSSTTNIDEILVLRKTKRMNSNVRKDYSTYIGRTTNREKYVKYLTDNPYASDLFLRLINTIVSESSNEDLIENEVLNIGYF